jgi:hypothetical protein
MLSTLTMLPNAMQQAPAWGIVKKQHPWLDEKPPEKPCQ